nr:class I SAM-dependent methyltransferase [Sphingomonas sp. Y57]
MVDIVNGLHPSSVVEIGCGLGEIIARIKSAQKMGADIDNAVIRSARSLYPDITFAHGGLEIVKDIKSVDIVICINWPHSLPSSQFITMVSDYCKFGNVGCLLIDTVNRRLSSEASHRYVCPDDLNAVGKIVSSIPSVDGARTFNLVALR